MRYRIWSQTTFDAGHRLVHDEFESLHGHRYRVRMYFEGTYDASKVLRPGGLVSIRDQFHGSVIDDLLAGTESTPAGIAAWLLEQYTAANAVEVWVGDDDSVTILR